MKKFPRKIRKVLIKKGKWLFWTLFVVALLVAFPIFPFLENHPLLRVICSAFLITQAYLMIFRQNRSRLILTGLYAVLICGFISLINPLSALWKELERFSWFWEPVHGFLKVTDGLNSTSMETIRTILVSLSVLLFCRDMLKWSEGIPQEEANCYRINELKLNRGTVATVLSTYCFFFSYWIQGYTTWLTPITLFTLFIVISQMVLLNFSGWKAEKIIQRATAYVFHGLPMLEKVHSSLDGRAENTEQGTEEESDALEESCLLILTRLGRAFAGKKTFERKAFQHALLIDIARKTRDTWQTQDETMIWFSIGMSCEVFAPLPENENEPKNEELFDSIGGISEISKEHKYEMMAGLLFGRFLNLRAIDFTHSEQSEAENWAKQMNAEMNGIQEYIPVIQELRRENNAGIDAAEMVLTKLPELFVNEFRKIHGEKLKTESILISPEEKKPFERLIMNYCQERGKIF